MSRHELDMDRKMKDLQKMSAASHIEDVADGPIDADAVLTDDDLRIGGLVPIRTFIRSRASANALRVQKAKAKAQTGEDGVARRQLNLVAPIEADARDVLKAVSQAMLDKRLTVDRLQAALDDRPATPTVDPVEEADRLTGRNVRAILDRGGLRAIILRRLIA